MKKSIIITGLILLFFLKTNGQPTFNKRFLFGYPVAALGSVLPTDSCYFATGIIVDSVSPFLVGNIFVKFDLEGNELFNKPLTSKSKYYDTWLGDLIMTNDGDLLDIGQTTDSLYKGLIIKYNLLGDTLQTKEYLSPYYPQSDFIVPFQAVQDSSGKIIILNDIEMANGNNDLSISIFDEQLNLLSHQVYGNQYDELPGNTILENDGGYILGANRDNTNFVSKGFWSKSWVFKIDAFGNIVWEYLSPSGILQDIAQSMTLSPDGGLVIASSRGYEHVINASDSQIRWQSAYFFKLNENQQLVWDLEVKDSINPGPELGMDRIISVDEGEAYVAAGKFNVIRSLNPPAGGTFGWLFKISDDGDLIWTRKYQILEALGHAHKFYDLKQTPDGGFILAGEIRGNFGQGEPKLQAWLLKLDSFGCLVPGCQWQDTVTVTVQPEKTGIELAIYPNPTSDYLNFQLRTSQNIQDATFRILNTAGRVVKEFKSNYAKDTFIVPVWDWTAGVYFLQYIENGEVIISERFVVLRK